jgi:enoyl-CoA hydratase
VEGGAVAGTVLEERVDGAVMLLTLNRPASLNAMSLELVRDLGATLTAVAADASCRAVVLTGAGRGFCSGHDLGELRDIGGVDGAIAEQELFAALVPRIRSLPQPVVAAVNGPAAGGGLALALAADTRVCSESARFNAAFVRIGLSGCDMGVSWLLPRLVGPTLAFEMMLSGRLVGAEEALARGLVLRVVPDGTVVDAALDIARAICENTPLGVRLTKQTMWANLEAPSLENAIAFENRTQELCVQSESFHEAVSTFIERRTGTPGR